MGSLTECGGCGRHVRRTETACPFCGVETIASERVVAPLPLDRRSLTRAAFVFASATVVAGCGKTNDPQPQPPNPTMNAPAYGPAPTVDQSPPPDAAAMPQVAPAYGVAPIQSGPTPKK